MRTSLWLSGRYQYIDRTTTSGTRVGANDADAVGGEDGTVVEKRWTENKQAKERTKNIGEGGRDGKCLRMRGKGKHE